MAERAEVEVYETFGGVAVFYPGRIFVADPPAEKRRRCCPRCGKRARREDRTGRTAHSYVFTCSACVSAEDRGPTTWHEEQGS